MNDDITLWRYIDLWKLEDMIKTSSLFFTFREELKRAFKDDACEAEDTEYRQAERKNIEERNTSASHLLANMTGATLIPIPPDELTKWNNLLNDTGINSWSLHKNYNKSMARKFCKEFYSGNFVALKTSFTDLLTAFPDIIKVDDGKEKCRFFHGKINYHVDYQSTSVSLDNKTSNWLFHMSQDGYEEEEEFRFTFEIGMTLNEKLQTCGSRNPLSNFDIFLKSIRDKIILDDNNKVGFHIPINLKEMNFSVYCPNDRIYNIVNEIITKNKLVNALVEFI